MSDKLSNLPDGVANGALFYAVDAGVSSKVTGGAANGVATLDAGGKVPSNLLPAFGVSYQGLWNASTNTPTLANGVGTAGDFYFVSVAGSQNLGSGVIAFDVNDRVIYEGGVWEVAPAHSGVQTVNAKPGPDVVLAAADVGALAAPVGAGASTVVGYNLGGQYSAVPYSQDTTGFNLIMRDIEGRAQFPDPAAATDVANKQWVEARIAASEPAPAWGAITGTLADQVDLHNALDAKVDDTTLATHVANVTVGAHVPTGGNSGQVLTRGAGAASAWAALTKAQVGLGSVDDTSDAAKPISTATQTALTAKANAADLTTHIGQTGAGVHLPPGGTSGQIPIKGAGAAVAWGDAPSGGGGAVTSVNGQTGVVLLGPDDVDAVSQAVAPNQVYTTDGSAQQSSLTYAANGDVTNGGVAVYTDAGRLKAVDPSVAGDVATKGYVDTAVAAVPAGVPVSSTQNVIYGTGTGGVQTTLPRAVVATASTVMMRDGNGRTQVVDPALATDVATKNYVDTHPGVTGGVPSTSQSNRVYVTSSTGTQSQIPYSNTEAEGGAMAQYDAGGRIFTAAPTDGSHATNKTYVDNAVSSGVTVAPHVIAGASTTFGIDGATPEIIYVDGTAAGKQITIDEANTSVGKTFTFIRKDDTPANTVTIDVELGSTLNTSGTPGGTTTGLDTQYVVKQLWKVEVAVWVWR